MTGLKIKVGTLNARSIRKLPKQKQLLDYFINSDLDVLNVQETWLDLQLEPTPEQSKLVRFMHSKPRDQRGEGVLTLIKREGMNIQPTLELLWTPWLMVTVIHKVGADLRNYKLVALNYYQPPCNHQQSLTHLKFVLACLKERHRTTCIIASGDFNMNPTQMKELELQTPLTLVEPTDWSQFISRTQRRGMSVADSVLDYHMTDMPSSRLEVLDCGLSSDHKLVVCVVEPSDSDLSIKDSKASSLKTHLGAKDAAEIMLNPSWPEEPYLEVAKTMGKCRTHKVFPDEAHTLIADRKKVMRNLDRMEA